MKRRDFLRFLLTTPLTYELDVEKLLWVPGEKTIFIPPPVSLNYHSLNYHDIMMAELYSVTPKLRFLFERDILFYRKIKELEGHE